MKLNFLVLQFWLTKFTSEDAMGKAVAMTTYLLKNRIYYAKLNLNSLSLRFLLGEFFKLCCLYKKGKKVKGQNLGGGGGGGWGKSRSKV